MTRKEEIEKASIEYQMSISPVAIGGAAFADDVEQMNINPSFVAGAQWADKTMIEKAAEWLNDWFTDDSCRCGIPITKTARDDFFNDFKKAMEEEK